MYLSIHQRWGHVNFICNMNIVSCWSCFLMLVRNWRWREGLVAVHKEHTIMAVQALCTKHPCIAATGQMLVCTCCSKSETP